MVLTRPFLLIKWFNDKQIYIFTNSEVEKKYSSFGATAGWQIDATRIAKARDDRELGS